MGIGAGRAADWAFEGAGLVLGGQASEGLARALDARDARVRREAIMEAAASVLDERCEHAALREVIHDHIMSLLERDPAGG